MKTCVCLNMDPQQNKTSLIQQLESVSENPALSTMAMITAPDVS